MVRWTSGKTFGLASKATRHVIARQIKTTNTWESFTKYSILVPLPIWSHAMLHLFTIDATFPTK